MVLAIKGQCGRCSFSTSNDLLADVLARVGADGVEEPLTADVNVHNPTWR